MQFKTFSLLSLYSTIQAQDCQDPGNDNHATRTDLGPNQKLYLCDQGYMTQEGLPQAVIHCVDGLWGPINPPNVDPICVEDSGSSRNIDVDDEPVEFSSCADPGQVENADRYEDHFDHGGTVFYSCQRDFCAQHLRTRTVEMKCNDGKWSNQAPKCVPCNACEAPTVEVMAAKKMTMTVNQDFTASLKCDEGYVIKPGTDITDGTVECIENGVWSPEIPTCSLRPNIVCGSNQMVVEINKAMLDSLGFDGGVNHLALVGLNQNSEIIMKDCKPTIDDAKENFQFTIDTPFAGKCMTHFEHRRVDGMGNEANVYVFRNKVVWRKHHGAVLRTSTVLDFTCEYDGLITTGLNGPIKLALSTRSYIDKRKGYNQQEFTVSMGIYANKNYTNLLESSQVVHRGKRYFVAMWLHENEKGTPFLDTCYGSPNEISQLELVKIGRQPEPDDQIRELIQDGCPVQKTLTRLEIPGSTADRRFSFMYPYVAVDGYKHNYMYIHCEIKLRPMGFKPNCVRPAAATAGSMSGEGLMDQRSGKLGKDQFFHRNYGLDGNNYDRNTNIKNINRWAWENGLVNDVKPYHLEPAEEMEHPQTEEELNKLKVMSEFGKKNIFGGGNNGPNSADNYEVFAGRKRRSVSNEDAYSVSLGPMVIVTDDDVKPEDITEVVIQTKAPLIANPDGTVSIDENAPEQESYEFKYNTTYKSDEDDLEKFVALLPADRYVEQIVDHPGQIIYDEQVQDKFADDVVEAEEMESDILAENILEEVEEEEQEEAENFAARAIAIIVGFLVGGGILFALTMFITMNTNLCIDSATKKKTARVNSTVPDQVVSGNAVHGFKQDLEKRSNKDSCGTSTTSAE